MRKDKQEAIRLRIEKGLSYNEIRETIKIPKSTLSLWLKDIILTPEQKERIAEKVIGNQDSFNVKLTPEERKQKGIRGGKKCQELHPQVKENLLNGRFLANLTFREDEVPVKNKLEDLTKMIFNKEKINNSYIDFANEKYLIEHTIDGTRGLSEAINRLSSLKNEERIKIIISKLEKLGPKRRREGIIYIDVKDFWNMEEWPNW